MSPIYHEGPMVVCCPTSQLHCTQLLQARVKATLQRKDEALAAAQQQIAALATQLRSTEAVLAQQQAELRML
jgi:hypothetical protein